MQITGATQHATGEVVVSTLLVNPHGGAPQPVDFRVLDIGGKPMIADFSVEGVWLAQEERDQFTAFLGQHGGFFLCLDLQLFFELFQVARVGFYGELSRDQKIAGIAVFHVHQFIAAAQVVYILD